MSTLHVRPNLTFMVLPELSSGEYTQEGDGEGTSGCRDYSTEAEREIKPKKGTKPPSLPKETARVIAVMEIW